MQTNHILHYNITYEIGILTNIVKIDLQFKKKEYSTQKYRLFAKLYMHMYSEDIFKHIATSTEIPYCIELNVATYSI